MGPSVQVKEKLPEAETILQEAERLIDSPLTLGQFRGVNTHL